MAVPASPLITHPAAVAFLAGIVAGSLPLLLPPGRNLEYEHVWMASILLVLMWPLTALTARRNQASRPPGRALAEWIIQALVMVTGLALPGALIFSFGMSPCSPSGYGQWVCAQALPASFVAGAFRQLLLLPGQSSRRRVLLLWSSGVGLSLLWLGTKLWVMPQKRTVDLFWGFLHGPLYDERIWLHADIWKARAAHLCLAVSAGFVAVLAGTAPNSNCTTHRRRWQILALTAIPLAAWLVLNLMTLDSPVTGHGLSILKKQFPKSHAGDGFTIFHHLDDESIARFSREARFHVGDLKEKLKLDSYPHVEIFAYPDARTKKLWFGGGATDVTDVRNAGIHITAGRRITRRHPTLRHELVHALTSRVAFHGLGFHPNMALTEGLAVALSPDANLFASMSLDEAAAELVNSGRVADPASLFNPWTFWLSSGPRAYTTAGSLIKFLVNTLGTGPILEIYAGKSWAQVFPANEGDVIAAWQGHLKQNAVPQLSVKMQARSMFRSRGIVYEACPHSFAGRMAGNPTTDDLLAMGAATGDPGYLLIAQRNQARQAFSEGDSTVRQERMAGLLKTLPGDNSWPPPDEESIEFRILASDVMRLVSGSGLSIPGQLEPDPLDRLAYLHEHHPLPPQLARQVVIRRRLDHLVATGKMDAGRAQDWRNYLAGWAELPPRKKDPRNDDAREAPEPWVLVYLRLRAAFNHGDLPGKTGYRAEELAGMTPDHDLAVADPSFVFEWYRHLAELMERGGENALAMAAWTLAAENSPNATARECMLENKQMIDGN